MISWEYSEQLKEFGNLEVIRSLGNLECSVESLCRRQEIWKLGICDLECKYLGVSADFKQSIGINAAAMIGLWICDWM